MERYRAGLLALGRRRLIVNVIARVPVDATPRSGSADEIAGVLDRPEMQGDAPLCEGAPIDQAYPARRIVELATAHPGVVRSVCDRRGLGAPLAEIGEYIAEVACY